jgi:hypothetical protein
METTKFKKGEDVRYDNKKYKVFSQEAEAPYLVYLADWETLELLQNDNGSALSVHPSRVNKF